MHFVGLTVEEMLQRCEESRSTTAGAAVEAPLMRVLALPRGRLMTVDPRERTCIMGILNATPDSFSDGGKDKTVQDAIARALHMVEEGCHIIDIGGESTRPGAAEVMMQEEMDRVLPIIEGIRKVDTDIPISIDTRRAHGMCIYVCLFHPFSCYSGMLNLSLHTHPYYLSTSVQWPKSRLKRVLISLMMSQEVPLIQPCIKPLLLFLYP